jgi:hypothetical protein
MLPRSQQTRNRRPNPCISHRHARRNTWRTTGSTPGEGPAGRSQMETTAATESTQNRRPTGAESAAARARSLPGRSDLPLRAPDLHRDGRIRAGDSWIYVGEGQIRHRRTAPPRGRGGGREGKGEEEGREEEEGERTGLPPPGMAAAAGGSAREGARPTRRVTLVSPPRDDAGGQLLDP